MGGWAGPGRLPGGGDTLTWACGKGRGESGSMGSGGSLGWAECYCFQVVRVSPSTCRREFSQIPLNLFENADSLFRRSTFTQHSAWRQRGVTAQTRVWDGSGTHLWGEDGWFSDSLERSGPPLTGTFQAGFLRDLRNEAGSRQTRAPAQHDPLVLWVRGQRGHPSVDRASPCRGLIGPALPGIV